MKPISPLLRQRIGTFSRRSLGLLALSLATLSPSLQAQEKPPLKILVGFPPGGSADVLEAAGIRLTLTPAQISDSIRDTGFGFMFAQAHHNATRHAAGPRRRLHVS